MPLAIGKYFRFFTELGITENLRVEEAKRVRLTNILGLIPMGMYLVYFLFGLFNAYYFPVVVCSILFMLSFIGLSFNKKGRYGVAKFMLFSVNSLSVFVTYNALNIDYSICCYFFPLLMAFEIVYDLKKEAKAFYPALGFTLLCAIACFVLPKGIFYFYAMSPDLLASSLVMNFVMPLVIAFLFMFLIMRIHEETEEKLIVAREQAEKAAKAKATFLSNMSHELRTPLNGIIGSTNFLATMEMTPAQKKYFDIIHYSSEHMLSLVNDVLDFSKIEADKLELDSNTFNLEQTLQHVGNMFANHPGNKQVQFINSIDPQTNVNVISDDLRLSQVLHNLLSNAFKFTRKGKVTFKVDCLSKTSSTITVRFAVIDTGIGIVQAQQTLIFDSFAQADSGTSRKFGGTGLGLSICKQLVEKFDSEIELKSETGKGSEFSFVLTLPTKIKHQPEALAVDVTGSKNLSDVRILVAEDNPVNMLLLRNFLHKWEASTVEVTNGEDALSRFKEEDFDLVLMDLEMPVMDGYAAIAEIRKMDNQTPVLAFTAALYDNMSQDLKSKGFNDFIHKPFKPQNLLQKIEENIGGIES
jgi:signal transduction histidine kinase/CheY-like chemotaxis protein